MRADHPKNPLCVSALCRGGEVFRQRMVRRCLGHPRRCHGVSRWVIRGIDKKNRVTPVGSAHGTHVGVVNISNYD